MQASPVERRILSYKSKSSLSPSSPQSGCLRPALRGVRHLHVLTSPPQPDIHGDHNSDNIWFENGHAGWNVSFLMWFSFSEINLPLFGALPLGADTHHTDGFNLHHNRRCNFDLKIATSMLNSKILFNFPEKCLFKLANMNSSVIIFLYRRC